MSEEKKRHMDNNLCLYYGRSSYKIGDYNKHQTFPSPSNIKVRKAKVAFSKKLKN